MYIVISQPSDMAAESFRSNFLHVSNISESLENLLSTWKFYPAALILSKDASILHILILLVDDVLLKSQK